MIAAGEGYQGFVLTGAERFWLVIALAAAVFGIVTGVVLMRGVLRADTGTAKMRDIAGAIQEGAAAFLRRQFRAIGIVLVPLAVLIFFTATKVTRPNGSVAFSFGASGGFRVLCFVFGATLSGLTGIIGMSLAVRGNVRTAAAARDGKLGGAVKVAIRTGGITGLLCVGLGLLGATIIVFTFQNTATAVLVGFGFGGFAHCAVHACRRRYLHQGRRRGSRPCRQGGGRHPRGRPAKCGHHRRQRGRQRR